MSIERVGHSGATDFLILSQVGSAAADTVDKLGVPLAQQGGPPAVHS